MNNKMENHRKYAKRNKLAEVLPLKTPFVIHIDVSSACNFKCKFCFHGLNDSELEKEGFIPKIMDLNLFKLSVDKIKEFPDKPKRLCLIRHGESLLNKNLPEMIRYAKNSHIVDSINLSTNGSLLTKERADAILDAGIDEVLVSVEAMSSEKYEEISGIKLDFNEFVNNIKYFNEKRGKCRLFIKTVDVALSEGEEQKFYDTFKDISDAVSIECIQPFFHGVDYSSIIDSNGHKNLIGEQYENINVCSQPFFQMHIDPDGNIGICNPDFNHKFVMGNVRTHSLKEVWMGKDWNEIRLIHLKGKRFEHEYCSFCGGGTCYTFEEDNLDPFADELVPLYEN